MKTYDIPLLHTGFEKRFFRIRKTRIWLAVLAVIAFGGYCSYIILSFYNQVELPKQYFIDPKDSYKWEYLVNTSTCKIVNLSLWSSMLTPYLKTRAKPHECKKLQRAWTFVNGSALIINQTALKESGFSLKRVRCCYKVITRVESSLDKYDNNSDRLVSTTQDCILVKDEQNHIPHEFIKVKCISTAWPMQGDLVYTQHHTLAQPEKNMQMKSKIEKWRARKEMPPNVLIIGIDSMSNANFARTMPKTKEILKEIGAKEMLGYTKVGYNTFPNVIAALSGYSEDELKEICYSPYKPQDKCPYIWKQFNTTGYLTAHLEDSPKINAFNYGKLGFVRQQVDFYLRPFMCSVYSNGFVLKYRLDCIGYKTVDETVLEYAESLLNASRNKAPLFLFTWISDLAHGDLNRPKFSDGVYENFLRRLDLNNTILFFAADHGLHYGQFTMTFIGWYENRLPNFWVYLPPNLREKYPSWMKSLQINSRRLSSPFDMYQTLEHILREFSHVTVANELNEKNEAVNRKHGQSFFLEIPEDRKCPDAGIKDDYCVCTVQVKINEERKDVKMAALAAIRSINNMLPLQCAALHLKKIVGAGTREEPVRRDQFVDKGVMTIFFSVNPGEFLFEAKMQYRSSSQEFIVKGSIFRASKMKRYVSCIKDYSLETFCYCI